MGRFGSPQLGYHAEEDENDIPELNKCPQCGAFFEGDLCPICKTRCPEEMKAGNRKPLKKARVRKSRAKGYRMPPVWYLRFWFILLISTVSRLAAVVLVWMTDWKTWLKVTATVLFLGGSYVFSFALQSFFGWYGMGSDEPSDYIQATLSEEEYRERCETVAYESLMRNPNAYRGSFMTETLTVTAVVKSYFTDSGTEVRVLHARDEEDRIYCVYDCRVQNSSGFLRGDTVVVYGEFAGVDAEYTLGTEELVPLIYGAYIDRIPE
ncbi:MAG: hypothetical protein E7618_08105 [Ruminococcaceae bacterium]|nr:hypothetical protein [Oscillospiraceae bacterium]